MDEAAIDVTAGPRYSLLINDGGAAYASGFIESKFEYLGQFGIDPDQLSEGSNTWKQINTVVNFNGNEVNSPAFAKVYAGTTGSANSGEMHSLLIDEEGNVYTTGNNNRGQLCLGDAKPRYIPHRVRFDVVDTPAIAAAIGEDFTLILLADGRVYGCGSNEKGELGLGSDVRSVDAPSNINGLPDIVELSAGLNFALYRAKNGKVYSSGSNIFMQQCDDSDGKPVVTPKVLQCECCTL
jgi:alpha-tubulin suppressor-like RCC1 family protein